MTRRRIASLALSAALVAGGLTGVSTTSSSAATRAPSWTRNCSTVNKAYPHGVGRAKAKDRVVGRAKRRPVTTFKRSDSLYNQAMRYNKRLDADRDGIACER
ncbi:calcium-binding protein [Acidipropionibacterium jensenii]|uniref:Calcium-binding protein n=1 Tax=Acidipropionibacterium jensenii TaxID=1749 RepID=A0A3Q9UN00_9ACTN|nr:excalibur calcium-binding domain-containing protein [Acidipropionibacterium jensenii]AZZ40804.1 calcium-binding protein [Acidipropionibacterium jensenii]